MTKEERKIYMKQWYQANKESKKQHSIQYYNKNLEYQKQYHKQQNESLKLPYHIVYLLPDHNYIGVTNRPYKRMSNHKRENNRNTSNWVELARYTDREEALAHEARLHNEGYEGANACYNINGR